MGLRDDVFHSVKEEPAERTAKQSNVEHTIDLPIYVGSTIYFMFATQIIEATVKEVSVRVTSEFIQFTYRIAGNDVPAYIPKFWSGSQIFKTKQALLESLLV